MEGLVFTEYLQFISSNKRKTNTCVPTLGVILTLGTCDISFNSSTTPCKHCLRKILVVGIGISLKLMVINGYKLQL